MILIISICIVVLFLSILFMKKRNTYSLNYEHVVITGGSSGIGLAFAIEVVKRGASVTIIARKKEKLDEAKNEIMAYVKSSQQNILTVSVDVSQYNDDFTTLMQEVEEKSGPITFLVNCAGSSVCCRFEDTPAEEFKRMLDVNYLGSVYVTKAVLPLMKSRCKGRIIYFSSLAGLVGLYGYSAYSASKFALVGMAEALQMEVKPYNISITVSFPPDTDTPGFAEEIKSKITETKLMCESGGLFSAKQVAMKTLNDAMNNQFMSSVGFEGHMLCTLCSGMTPAAFFNLIIQVLCMGIYRIFGYIYLLDCYKIVRKCSIEKKNTKS